MESSSESAFKVMNQDFVKLDRFDGTNFSRWKDKMMFFLTALKIAYVLDPSLPEIPEPKDGDSDEVKAQHRKRAEDELLCRGHIMNTLSDRLYDLYTAVKSPKEIWNALEYKYNTMKQGADKFLIMQYFDFRIIENSSLMDQIHDLQVIVSKLHDLKVEISESLQVGAIIAKLPTSWNDYKKKLLHTTESFTTDQILKHLRIEEDTRNLQKKQIESDVKVNALSEKNSQNFSGSKRKSPDASTSKDKKKNRICYKCGKKGHYKRECKADSNKKQKKDNAKNANLVEQDVAEIVAMISHWNIGMISELYVAAATKSCDWWYDSGATVHVCNDKSQFKTYEEVPDGHKVLMGNHDTAKVIGIGSVDLQFTSGKKLILANVLHVPEIRKNLVSADALNKKGLKAVIESNKLIFSLNGVFVGKGYSCDGMFKLCINKNNVSVYIVDASYSLWHGRLAHTNHKTLQFMSKHGLISFKDNVEKRCETCIQAKMTRLPFPKAERNNELLDLVHSDVCEFNGFLTRGGNKYFITFIDDYSRYVYVYLMKTKDESFHMFKCYKNLVENQLGKKVKILRNDRGGEYLPADFSQFCEENGIMHQTSAPYTPQQNGLAERKNRTLGNMVNAMIISSGLPKNLWGEALLAACHIHNRVTSLKSKVSPYELWKGRKPNLKYFRVWGCIAFYRVPDHKRTKLGPRALKSVFVGYAENSKAYRLLDLDSNVIVESRDVEFLEDKFLYNSTMSTDPSQEPPPVSNARPSNNNKRNAGDIPSELRRSQRQRKEKHLSSDFIDSQAIVFLVEGDRQFLLDKIPILLTVEDDPKTFSEAMKSRDASFWREAINDEMDSLLSNNTWILVDLPPGSKPIGCKWVFRKKYATDGSVQTFKARLVAKGFRQKEGIDYFDTYAPVARITSIRVLLALASMFDLCVHQMDVKTAFLNGDLNEEVYMDQPEGFVLPGNEKKVCKLTRSLYGLKQAPKQWHQKFESAILSNGFKYNNADKCIYSKFTREYGVIICLYVDDMLIIGTNYKGVEETKKYLSSIFKMKDLGEVDTILGIKVKRHSGGYSLSQSHYVEKVLNKYQHLKIKEVSTPYDPNFKLFENSGKPIAQLEYASAIGSLMYATHCTRPDISYAVCRLARYTKNPGIEHWKAIGRVLGYLKRTKDLELSYNKFPVVLEGYSDASWVTSVCDKVSTSGWIFMLGGGAVSWASKKQTVITHSTMEAEFVALAAACKEAEWLRNLLLDIELWPKPMPAISLHCDSEATMSRALNRIYNGKSRHISLRHEYVRQLLNDGIVTVVYVRSFNNLADPFTKALSRDVVKATSLGMGLKPIV